MAVLRRSATLALAATILSSGSEWLPLCSGFTPLGLSLAGRVVPTVHRDVATASEAVAEAETAAVTAKETSSSAKTTTKKKSGPNKKKGKKMEMTLTVTNGDKKTAGKNSSNSRKKRSSPKVNGAKGKGGPRFKHGYKKKGGKPKPLKPLSDLVLGSKINGVVAGLSDFGAFIKTDYKIQPKDDPTKPKGSGYALLHKSQIQDEKIENISKVLRVGDRIKNARVINVNYAKGEVGLSLRKPRPKRRSFREINVGDELDGKVKSVTSYGAFIDIGAKKNALLHISRITQDKVINIRDYVNEGDWVTVHIIEKNTKTDKPTLACSMLDKNADDYIDRRQKRMQKRKSESREDSEAIEKTELEFFEDAIRELEETLR